MRGQIVPNKKPLQGEPIRGSDTLKITERPFDGNIPNTAINVFKQEATGIMHGTVTLTIHVKDGLLSRYVINRERSIIPGRPTTGTSNDK
jgi:hypothetical protein